MYLGKFAWLTDTALAEWVASSAVVWPMLECIHFVSLCFFMGGLLVIDLRLIGFYRNVRSAMIKQVLHIVLAAFSVNFFTGILFFAGNTYKYIDNPAFELKIMLIITAGLNALFYKLRLSHLLDTTQVTGLSVFVGYFSLLLWAGVIVCGRMITFFAR